MAAWLEACSTTVPAVHLAERDRGQRQMLIPGPCDVCAGLELVGLGLFDPVEVHERAGNSLDVCRFSCRALRLTERLGGLVDTRPHLGEATAVQTDTGPTILPDSGPRRATISVPRNLLEGDPQVWQIAVVLLSREGYSPAGVWSVRDLPPSIRHRMLDVL